MSGKFKITLSNGNTYEAASDQEFDEMMTDFDREGLDPRWEKLDVPARVESPEDAGTYVDEMNVLGSAAPTAAAAKNAPAQPQPSAWDTFKRSALPALRGAGATALDGYRMLTHGVTLGYDDDIADGVAKLAQKLGYQGSGQSAAQANAAAIQRSPYVGATAKTAGNMITGIGAGMLAAPAAAAAGLTPAAAGVLESGVLGAAQAGGEAEANKLDAAGRGATFGLGTGVAGAGVGALASKLSQRLTQGARAQRGQVLAPTMKVTQDLQDRYGAQAADDELGQLLEKHVPPNALIPRSASEYRDALAAKLSKTGKQLQDTVLVAGARGANEAVPAAQEKLIQQIGERADEVGGQVGQMNANTHAQLQRYLKQLTSKADEYAPARANPKTAPQDIAGFWKQRQNFDADARYSPTGTAPDTAAAAAAQIAAGENRDLLKGLVKQHAPELAQEFADGNTNYGDIAMLKDIAARASASEANTSPLKSFLINSALGGTAGTLTGAALGDSNPLERGATWAAASGGIGTMAQSAKFLNSPTGRDTLANLARFGSRPAAALGSTLQSPAGAAASGYIGARMASKQEQPAAITSTEKVQQALRNNPQALGAYAAKFAGLEGDELTRAVETTERDDKNFSALLHSLGDQ